MKDAAEVKPRYGSTDTIQPINGRRLLHSPQPMLPKDTATGLSFTGASGIITHTLISAQMSDGSDATAALNEMVARVAALESALVKLNLLKPYQP